MTKDDDEFYQMAMKSVGCLPYFMNSSEALDSFWSKEQAQKHMRITYIHCQRLNLLPLCKPHTPILYDTLTLLKTYFSNKCRVTAS